MLLVCGEALFDLFLQADSDEESPRFEARAGGSPFNVAIGAARLGGRSALFTGVSSDFLGEKLARRLKKEKVGTEYLVRSERRTTLSLVGLNASGSAAYSFYGAGSADCSLTMDDLPTLADEIDALHFGSYSIAVSPSAETFLALAAREGGERLISLDPNVRPTVQPDFDVWRKQITGFASQADVIKISDEDFNLLYPGQSHEEKAREWLAGGVSLVVVTSGGEGAEGWTKSTHAKAMAPKISVIDTVGAGDTFQAALLHRLRHHDALKPGAPAGLCAEALEDCLHYSATAAAITCTRRGADLPDSQDVDAKLKS